jgi:DNA-binding MarR family transcriptional regulator
MALIEPLSPTEDALWRALMRIVKSLPRNLDSDLVQGAGLTASEYSTIMHLSEAPNRELRMSELANAAGVSASRTTRLVDDLQSRSLVRKVASSTDARGNIAKLTPRGMAKLKEAWPIHLESVRTQFLDHLDPAAIPALARELSMAADQLDDSSPGGTRQVEGRL